MKDDDPLSSPAYTDDAAVRDPMSDKDVFKALLSAMLEEQARLRALVKELNSPEGKRLYKEIADTGQAGQEFVAKATELLKIVTKRLFDE